MEVKEREAGHFDIRSHSDACRHMPLKKLNFWLKKKLSLNLPNECNSLPCPIPNPGKGRIMADSRFLAWWTVVPPRRWGLWQDLLGGVAWRRLFHFWAYRV